MKLPILSLLTGTLLLSFSSVQARTCTAVNSTRWEQASTWSCGSVPGCGDTIVIPAGKTVEISSVLDYRSCGAPIVITVNGVLTFQTGKKLMLPCNSYIQVNTGGSITAGGGGGNSNLIEICTNIVWNAAMGTLTGPLTLSVTPLPVELLHFEARESGSAVELIWKSESEKNNDRYILDRSSDGKSYTTIGTVKGAGTTPKPNSYTFTDAKPMKGYNYYRLNQIDFDGRSVQLGVVVVKLEHQVVFDVYPNPTSGELYATITQANTDSPGMCTITRSDGVTVSKKPLPSLQKGSRFLLIGAGEKLTPGFYVISIKVGDETFFRHVVAK